MKKLLIYIMLVFSGTLFAQNKETNAYIKVNQNNDTLITYPLKEVVIKSRKTNKRKWSKRRTSRLIRYVKKVYPYAKLAGNKLDEYDSALRIVDKASKRRKIMRRAEKEIKEEFGADLKKLTFMQGKILLKLIDRETGDSSFELLKDLRGGFSAFFYQSFARLFGFNLKHRYDPKGKDWRIEQIVRQIEASRI